MKKITKQIIFLSLLFPILVLGHGGAGHEKKVINPQEETTPIKEDILISINKSYVENVKPIFKVKCFDCHAKIDTFPWYYKIPGIKQLMDYDMKEAKEHLDMSKDFPFVSHETPLKDLKSLKEVVEEGEMPPIQYVLGHWDSRLTEDEKKKLFNWVENSIKQLGEKK